MPGKRIFVIIFNLFRKEKSHFSPTNLEEGCAYEARHQLQLVLLVECGMITEIESLAGQIE